MKVQFRANDQCSETAALTASLLSVLSLGKSIKNNPQEFRFGVQNGLSGFSVVGFFFDYYLYFNSPVHAQTSLSIIPGQIYVESLLHLHLVEWVKTAKF